MRDLVGVLVAAIIGNGIAFLMHRSENMRQTKILEEIRDQRTFKG